MSDELATVAVAEAQTDQVEAASETAVEIAHIDAEVRTAEIEAQTEIAETQADAAVAIAEAQANEGIDELWLNSKFDAQSQALANLAETQAQLAAAVSTLAEQMALWTPIAPPAPTPEAETIIAAETVELEANPASPGGPKESPAREHRRAWM
jgi:hypothetical protein